VLSIDVDTQRCQDPRPTGRIRTGQGYPCCHVRDPRGSFSLQQDAARCRSRISSALSLTPRLHPPAFVARLRPGQQRT
jgi:hypothetical protein